MFTDSLRVEGTTTSVARLLGKAWALPVAKWTALSRELAISEMDVSVLPRPMSSAKIPPYGSCWGSCLSSAVTVWRYLDMGYQKRLEVTRILCDSHSHSVFIPVKLPEAKVIFQERSTDLPFAHKVK